MRAGIILAESAWNWLLTPLFFGIFWGILNLIWKYYLDGFIKIGRIRSTLHCDLSEARQIHNYLTEIGVEWMTYHKWATYVLGKLMPMVMINDPNQNRLIATWQESRQAMLKLSLERRLKPEWTKQDVLGAVGLEIIKRRQSEGLNIFDPYD